MISFDLCGKRMRSEVVKLNEKTVWVRVSYYKKTGVFAEKVIKRHVNKHRVNWVG